MALSLLLSVVAIVPLCLSLEVNSAHLSEMVSGNRIFSVRTAAERFCSTWWIALISWKPPKTSQFWQVCDSIGQVCAGGRRCAVRLGFSMLTNG
jgi:hypothetical protein